MMPDRHHLPIVESIKVIQRTKPFYKHGNAKCPCPPMCLSQGYFLQSHFQRDFPYEKHDRHCLPRRCPATWKYRPVLEPRLPEGCGRKKSGAYKIALRGFRPLAKKGVADAQFNLGA